MQRHTLFSGILMQSHLHQKIYLCFVSYLQLFLCLECYFLHWSLDQIDVFLDLTNIAHLTNLFSTLRAVAIWPNVQPNGKYILVCTAPGDFEDVVDFDLTFYFCHFNFSWAVFTTSRVCEFCLLLFWGTFVE